MKTSSHLLEYHESRVLGKFSLAARMRSIPGAKVKERVATLTNFIPSMFILSPQMVSRWSRLDGMTWKGPAVSLYCALVSSFMVFVSGSAMDPTKVGIERA